MVRMNDNFAKLASSYLFVEISRRVTAFQDAHPGQEVIKLGIGDVTKPLPASVIEAFHAGVAEQAHRDTFRGYGPERGYEFLRSAIADVDFASRGCTIHPDEIFVSDGAKCDTGNFQELFAVDSTIAVPDPVYPVYVDSNVMAGRAGEAADGRYSGIRYLDASPQNGFVPEPGETDADLIYLCFPNNPTGSTANRSQLQAWVDHARSSGSIILYDAAYEQFIRDEEIPHSIFEIPGARDVAVEFRSLSKTAGFTGVRCAYTVVPRTLEIAGPNGKQHAVWDLWNRRQSTKFNGVSYPVQRAAEAVFTETGQREIRELSDFYLKNAALIRSTIKKAGYHFTGGTNSPYVWVETGGDSWDFFERILQEAGVVVTPGSGFGRNGQGFVRFSAFNDYERVAEAMERVARVL